MINKIVHDHSNQNRLRQWVPLISLSYSLFLALGSCILFFQRSTLSQLESVFVNFGLDVLRSQLIAALIMTLIAALIGAALGRSRLGALLGAGAIFGYNYLGTFIRTETEPFYDPGGLLEPLNQTVFQQRVLIIMALALLSAFIGAAVGKALAEVMIDPLVHSLRWIWRRIRISLAPTTPSSTDKQERTSTSGFIKVLNVLLPGLGFGTMALLIILVSNSSDLFLFSPDIGLHSPPTLALTHVTGLPSQGTVVKDSLVSAALNGQNRPFLVYLPPSYNTPQGATKRYPTLYLLHGSPGSDNDWMKGGLANQSADTLIATHKIRELIIISPDGNGRPGETSEWGNSFDQKQRIETYIATDLVHYVDQHYRTIADPAYRAIGGNSMGGFGAANIAIHHPDIFGITISLGGYYLAEGAVWDKNVDYQYANSPFDVMPKDKKAWKLLIYLGAATKDQPYYNDTKQFMQELRKLRIPYHFDLQQGYHAWHIWQVQLYNALLWIPWG